FVIRPVGEADGNRGVAAVDLGGQFETDGHRAGGVRGQRQLLVAGPALGVVPLAVDEDGGEDGLVGDGPAPLGGGDAAGGGDLVAGAVGLAGVFQFLLQPRLLVVVDDELAALFGEATL